MTCNCGIPNKADWYYCISVGKDIDGGTKTKTVDMYLCNEHIPTSIGELPRGKGWYVIDYFTADLKAVGE